MGYIMMKKKVLLSFYNVQQIGGPSTAMRRIMNSSLRERYEFTPIIINERLGKIIRLGVIKRLVKEIRTEKPDIIYFTGMQLQGFYMALSAWLAGYGKRTIMVVRGSSGDAMNVGHFFLFLFRNVIEPITCRLAHIVHTVCIEMANNIIIKKNVKNFGGVIHNAAPVIIKKYSREVFRNELQVNEDDILLIYTGRIIEDKGIAVLLQAMTGLGRNVKLVLVGDGNIEQFKSVSQNLGIASRTFFLGQRDDVLQILAGCDIFVFPTLHENLSNSLLEACASGLPIIATDVGGNPEVVSDGVEGYIIPPNDSEALAKAVQKMAGNRECMTKMGEAAKHRMRTEFSQENIYHEIDLLFSSIAN